MPAIEKIADQLPSSNDQVKWSQRVSQFGSAYSMASPEEHIFVGLFTKNERIRETGMMSNVGASSKGIALAWQC